MPAPPIREKQIKWDGPGESPYAKIVKALSRAGFVWDPNDFTWHRARDKGGMSDEGIETIVKTFPAFVKPLIDMIEHGAASWNIHNDEQPDGSFVSRLVPVFNAIDAVVKAGEG
jgi:hypothetical protein